MPRKTITQSWLQQAEALEREAETLPVGRARDALLKKARQLRTASEMDRWISSPGLKPPDDLRNLAGDNDA
ncbi:hypothetical protein [Afipia clevelandensis]|uniref:Uncharacterized protein n=1 Tax=Afipia clevelandensis ATCC 49720 TaxID=883079 RepID=K8PGM4_9BRAD|nr:hypothetical protein [Afipia clevelandensis]EKS39924.1 hypothetical protein HMPREF9696_00936 [Afipia clevelandensis ATCC 49720]